MKQLLSLFVLLAISSGASAIMKCSNGSQTWYQDTPCAAGSVGTTFQSAPMGAAAAQMGNGPLIAMPQEPAPPLPPPPSHIPAAVLEQEAQQCLAWYQKEVLLPPDAQILNFTKDRRVLTISTSFMIDVLNYWGGQSQSRINKQASCEIHNGRLDDSWTRIHAKRGGWTP